MALPEHGDAAWTWQPSWSTQVKTAQSSRCVDEEAGDDDWVRSARRHRYTVIYLHSCNGNPSDGKTFANDLSWKQAADAETKIVAPAAPLREAGDEWPEGSHQWFNYGEDDMKLLDPPYWAQLRAQRQRLLRLLDREVALLPEDGGLIIGGLSQGGSMALDVVLHWQPRDARMRRKLRGVFVRRGVIQKESVEDLTTRADGHPELNNLEILTMHGDEDEYVDIEHAFRSYQVLADCGASLQRHRLHGLGHIGYSEEELDLYTTFVKDRLSRWT